jgi:hypothetical protein
MAILNWKKEINTAEQLIMKHFPRFSDRKASVCFTFTQNPNYNLEDKGTFSYKIVIFW